jgi:hypothetical protein
LLFGANALGVDHRIVELSGDHFASLPPPAYLHVLEARSNNQ